MPRIIDDQLAILVGLNIARLRVKARMTQQQLAEAMGITQQQVFKYEKASNILDIVAAHKVSQIFKVDVSELYKKIEIVLY